MISRGNGECAVRLRAIVQSMNVPLQGITPPTEDVSAVEFPGRRLVEWGDASAVYQDVEELMRKILN